MHDQTSYLESLWYFLLVVDSPAGQKSILIKDLLIMGNKSFSVYRLRANYWIMKKDRSALFNMHVWAKSDVSTVGESRLPFVLLTASKQKFMENSMMNENTNGDTRTSDDCLKEFSQLH